MMMITSEKAQTFPPNLRNVLTNEIPKGRVRLEGPASCVRQVAISTFHEETLAAAFDIHRSRPSDSLP